MRSFLEGEGREQVQESMVPLPRKMDSAAFSARERGLGGHGQPSQCRGREGTLDIGVARGKWYVGASEAGDRW